MTCFYLDPELKNILGNHATFDTIFSLEGILAKQKPGRKTLCFTLQGKPYFLKKHTGVGWWEILKNWGQGKKPVTSARNEWQAIQYLTQKKMDTMTLVGYGERLKNPARIQSFIVTRALENTETLERLGQDWDCHPLRFSEKTRLIQKVALLTRRMHALGLSHRDYYLCHLRIEPTTLKIYIMDLHRAVIYQNLPMRWRVKDIGALYFSSAHIHLTRRDRYRFMQAYSQLSLREISRTQGKFWHQVERRAIKMRR
ncbi:MAG: lipopolysaccharide core heptose(I) kinase RfaP [Gammaproteobacteria bacterium]|nr:lipopolysaccharide core heptose(I) kinase RfaP [Gammaproteobacteria bacterium]